MYKFRPSFCAHWRFLRACLWVLIPVLSLAQEVPDKKLLAVQIIDMKYRASQGLLLEHTDSTITLLDNLDLKTKHAYRYEEIWSIQYFKRGTFGRGFLRGLGVGELIATGVVFSKEPGYFGRGFDFVALSVLIAGPAAIVGGIIDARSGVKKHLQIEGDAAALESVRRKLRRYEPGEFATIYRTPKGNTNMQRLPLMKRAQLGFGPAYPMFRLQVGYGGRKSRFRSALNNNFPSLENSHFGGKAGFARLGLGFSPTKNLELEYSWQSKTYNDHQLSESGDEYVGHLNFYLSTVHHQLNLFYKPLAYNRFAGSAWQFSVGSGLSFVDSNLSIAASEHMRNADTGWTYNSDGIHKGEVLTGINAITQIEYFIIENLSFQLRFEGIFILNDIGNDHLTLEGVPAVGEGMEIPENSIAPHALAASLGISWHLYDH